MATHPQIEWDDRLECDARALIRLALAEDLGDVGDITTQATVPADRRGAADIVAREAGVLAGALAPALVLEEANADARWTPHLADGDRLAPGTVVGRIEGAARDLLSCERTILNLVNRLCGVATLTRRYADAVEAAPAMVCDTRKTTPGWRRLEKFAVRCGGGSNHRLGLHDAVLIKDNHLVVAGQSGVTLADAVRQSRERFAQAIIEVEVDTLEQLQQVLVAEPDIVLLDNMKPAELRDSVAIRAQHAPSVLLEASGGVTLDTIGEIAQTGVERISVGALTHAARSLDLGLDWAS
ncbi:MAG: carboxylating nicotinate-nucleotide diphosphorylase [Planctomycetota bacterium]